MFKNYKNLLNIISKKNIFDLKFFLTIFLTFFLFVLQIYGTDIEMSAYVYKDSTIFNYKFLFEENQSITKFSLEKPKNSKLIFATSSRSNIDYTEAGDFFIFEPKNLKNDIILIKIESKSNSEEILKSQSFKNYQNLNIKIDSLKYNLVLKDDFGEIIDIFPENYNLLPNNQIKWEIKNMSKDLLFVVNFKKRDSKTNLNSINYLNIGIYFFLILISFMILIFGFIFYKKHIKENKKEKKLNVDVEDNLDEKNKEDIIIENQNKIVKKTENFEDFVKKHLTQNEKEIVELIKDNQGIIQNEILNFLPQITKSNLSKIISKLDSKKILKRIKVGKINKIYLGEKINIEEEKIE